MALISSALENHKRVEKLFEKFKEELNVKQVSFHNLHNFDPEEREKDLRALIMASFAMDPAQNKKAELIFKKFVDSHYLNKEFVDSDLQEMAELTRSAKLTEINFPYDNWLPNDNCFCLINDVLSLIQQLSLPVHHYQYMQMNAVKLGLNNWFTENSNREILMKLVGALRSVPNLGKVKETMDEVTKLGIVEIPGPNILESLASSTTFLRMRYFQLKCAMVFNPWFYTFVSKIMTRFKERMGPVAVLLGILELQIQLLILFAKGKFERAYCLAQQGVDAIQEFLRNKTQPSGNSKVSITMPERIEENLRGLRIEENGEYTVRDSIVDLFPLDRVTDMDKLFYIGGEDKPFETHIEFRVNYFTQLVLAIIHYVLVMQAPLPTRKKFLISFNETFNKASINSSLCLGCNETKKCQTICPGGCNVLYCSNKCLKDHWKHHRRDCPQTRLMCFACDLIFDANNEQKRICPCRGAVYCCRGCDKTHWYETHVHECTTKERFPMVNCFNCELEIKKKDRRICACDTAHYCDKKCQEEHWPEHNKFCTKGSKGTFKRRERVIEELKRKQETEAAAQAAAQAEKQLKKQSVQVSRMNAQNDEKYIRREGLIQLLRAKIRTSQSRRKPEHI
jgi:hypothetical protein